MSSSNAASSAPPTLGALLKALRAREGLTLKEMSAKSGNPVSTLLKIEHDRLIFTYDKLQSFARRLGLRMSDLFTEPGDEQVQAVTARRSLGDVARSVRVETPSYDYYYLCTELRRKRMIPVVTKTRARSAEQFGDLVRHSGEEFVYVLRGKVEVQTEFYDPVTLEPGQARYLDSSISHAYLAATDCDEAEVPAVMSSEEE